MTIRQKTLYVLGTLFLLCVFLVEGTYWSTDYKDVKVETGSGVITERFEDAFACGSYGDQICYARFFVLNNDTRREVNRESFLTYKVGDHIVLSTMESPKLKWYQKIAQGLHWILGIILLICGVIWLVLFLNWALTESDEKTFKEYLNED